MARTTNKSYKEDVRESYIKSVTGAIDNNDQLSESQKLVLNEYRDDLESQIPINFVDETGRYVRLKAIKSYKSLDTYIRKIVNFAMYCKKDFDKVTREDVRKYRLHLKNQTITYRNSYKFKSEKNDRTMSNVTIEFYFTLIKRFFIWYYNKDQDTTILPDVVKNFRRGRIERTKIKSIRIDNTIRSEIND